MVSLHAELSGDASFSIRMHRHYDTLIANNSKLPHSYLKPQAAKAHQIIHLYNGVREFQFRSLFWKCSSVIMTIGSE